MEKEAIDYPCTLITENMSRMKLNKRAHSASLSVKEVLKSPRVEDRVLLRQNPVSSYQ
jgi:hypothetical protein